MPSVYNSNGTMKPHRQYDAGVWAHDLSINNIRLYLQHPGKKQSSYERSALLKEFRARVGVGYSKATKEQKAWKPD